MAWRRFTTLASSEGIDCRCERINQEREVKLLSMILFPLNISSSFSNCNHFIPNEYNSRKFLYQLCTYASVFVDMAGGDQDLEYKIFLLIPNMHLFDHLTSKSFHMEQILNTSTLELTSILERQKVAETINYNTLKENSLIINLGKVWIIAKKSLKSQKAKELYKKVEDFLSSQLFTCFFLRSQKVIVNILMLKRKSKTIIAPTILGLKSESYTLYSLANPTVQWDCQSSWTNNPVTNSSTKHALRELASGEGNISKLESSMISIVISEKLAANISLLNRNSNRESK
ncbi:hypothetical protein HYC85_020014 [Camellia sinensis]|uniref:Uncharacterized protein n=1 Tax=Camellia sinensis TaxID=4442 RepID=A0A7J7GNK4_CAMSI|nr:hypothetical protein HYC85_020014 [Camellia sinensis]